MILLRDITENKHDLLFQSNPNDITCGSPDISRLMPRRDVVCLHPAHVPIRRVAVNLRRRIRRPADPLTALDKNVERIRMVRVDPFPLTGLQSEMLDDYSIILENVFSRNVRIAEKAKSAWLDLRRVRHRLQNHFHELDRCRPNVAPRLLWLLRSGQPDGSAILPRNRASSVFRLEYPAMHEHDYLRLTAGVSACRLARTDGKRLYQHPLIVQHHLARQLRE